MFVKEFDDFIFDMHALSMMRRRHANLGVIETLSFQSRLFTGQMALERPSND